MAFTPKDWTYSNINADELINSTPTQIVPGEQFLIIEDAVLDETNPASPTYKIKFRSCSEGTPIFTITQYLLKKDGTKSGYAIKWLNNLGYACCGVKTTLTPDEYRGCVVKAVVGLAPSYKDKEKYVADMKEKGSSDVKLYATINADDIEPAPRSIVEVMSDKAPLDDDDESAQFFVEDDE